ncbi:hypothetical protein ACP70R_000677 [Stipagrostis hirtigluma subsp. patula]
MATASNGGAGGKGEGKAVDEGEGNGPELTLSHDGFPANFAEIIASLPQEQKSMVFPSYRLYRGFWLPETVLKSLPQVHAHFNLSPTDILIASVPKSGTTWLKALCFATARRSVYSPFDSSHPLLCNNSHDCVKNMDVLWFLDAYDGEMPRIISTHMPYSLLPERATADGSGCRIVHISRDPKDTLVSSWHFDTKAERAAGNGAQTMATAVAVKFEEAFELYCQGRYILGPPWEHAREYWEASKRRPKNLLCLKYEEMLCDPASNLRKMAAFIGCPFSEAEEESGVVHAILELCTIDKQRSLEVNKSGAYVIKGVSTIGNEHFYRKGVAGDWRNHMTSEMAARLDGIVKEAIKGSGFTFGKTK